MHNPESALENETHKFLCDFEIQTDHQISARRLDIITINNNNNKRLRAYRIVDFVVQADHRVKLKECERRDKYLDLARKLKKKTVKHESDDNANGYWCSWYSHQRID